MSVDIRQYTRIIIRKNGLYLFGFNEFTKIPEWRISPFDAWWTRDKDAATVIARKTGGIPILFNTVIGRTEM